MSPDISPPHAPKRRQESPGILRRLHLWGVQNPKWYYIGPPSAWATFIYVVSLAPIQNVKTLDLFMENGRDKLLHGTCYALFSLLILRGWQREKMPPFGLHAFVWTLSVAFGTMIEILQGLTSYRTFEFEDIVADAVGALAGQAIWHLLMVKWGKRTKLYPGLFRPKRQG